MDTDSMQEDGLKLPERGPQVALASMVGMGLLIAASGAAHASPAQTAPTVRTARIASADIVRVSHRADMSGAAQVSKLRAQGSDKVQAQENSRVTDFLDRRARAGHLLRKADVQVATIANPLLSGHSISVVWSGSSAPGDISLQSVGDDENGASGLGIQFQPDGSAETLDGAPAQLAGGSGYDAGVNPKNMYKYSNGCNNAYWDASYSSTDYHVESCFEKWAQSGTSHWVYNRWGLFTRPNSTTANPDIRDFTIRSKPWKVDLYHPSSYISKLNSWQPTGPSQSCTTKTATLGGTYNGITANIGIPVQTCNTSILHIDTGLKMIGIGVEGHEPTGRQVRVDVGGDYTATDKSSVPVWADYAWATVRYIKGPQTVTDTDDYVLKDSGW
ncbi:hypothetical protein COUCH_05485 [Couchioplanes caeruleus]|uniref:hypothetical protein n=1 Tax=Couchioplanes caeruleus TaxID=56438 RepID=UPI0020BF2EFA|nr:hypothetical protein [Couchioplanes caeruleus]UQU65772.1 hypothetical protein COUCH_05485 [Couchioplanes caeruleus]